ncbi:MAG: RNA polymerase sigma factor RpoS [Betaproteobacteria bacterium]|nr:RNA polymerase sigma factor RpoS [Betaproteobacteria bacterium]
MDDDVENPYGDATAGGETTEDTIRASDVDDDGAADAVPDDVQLDVTQIYLREIGYSPLLSAAEEHDLAVQVVAGDFAARQKMIASNLRLVVNVAKHYSHRGLPLLDLVEEGNLGLIHALEKFDPARGFRFSTYAIWWIRQYIERALMEQSRTVRLPVHVIKVIHVILRARQHLMTHGFTEPADADIADLVGLPVEEVRQMLRLNDRALSLDTPLDSDADVTMVDVLADEQGEWPDHFLQRMQTNAFIDQWLAQLTSRQRWVIERRFGLNDRDVQTLEQLALDMAISRERVRQIQTEALQLLRKMLWRQGMMKDALL